VRVDAVSGIGTTFRSGEGKATTPSTTRTGYARNAALVGAGGEAVSRADLPVVQRAGHLLPWTCPATAGRPCAGICRARAKTSSSEATEYGDLADFRDHDPARPAAGCLRGGRFEPVVVQFVSCHVARVRRGFMRRNARCRDVGLRDQAAKPTYAMTAIGVNSAFVRPRRGPSTDPPARFFAKSGSARPTVCGWLHPPPPWP